MKNRKILMQGERVDLALFTKNEIDEVQDLSLNLNSAGDFWLLLDFRANESYEKRISLDGYFSEDSGHFHILDKQGAIVGSVVYFKPVQFWNAREVGFRIYSQDDWGKGYATNVLRLITSFLFERSNLTRIQITTDTENFGVHRIAEKCGFQKEGILRNTTFCRGKVASSVIYSMLPCEAPSLQSLLVKA